MKLHFLLVCAVAIGLLSSAPDSFARGGGGGGGGRGGGSSFHGGFHGGFRGGFRGRGGRFGGRFFRGGRFFGPGFGFYGFGYPWWGGWWGWDYPYYPYYGYYGSGYYGDYGSGDYGSDPSYGSNANYGGSRGSDQDPRFSTTRGVQAALAWRGYYSGRIDGVMGQETSEAIRSFQAHQGLPTTGRIDNATINALQRR
jgi:Putative peptidoglycan binding domain